jgi:hypothetical protein
MVMSITNLTTGQSYTIPYNGLQVELQKQIMATTIAIPLSNEPILLNYGGDQINLTVGFITTTESDITNLINNFSQANGSIYEVDLEDDWGTYYSGSLASLGSFQGFVSNLEITQNAGEGQVWHCSLSLMIGQPV